ASGSKPRTEFRPPSRLCRGHGSSGSTSITRKSRTFTPTSSARPAKTRSGRTTDSRADAPSLNQPKGESGCTTKPFTTATKPSSVTATPLFDKPSRSGYQKPEAVGSKVGPATVCGDRQTSEYGGLQHHQAARSQTTSMYVSRTTIPCSTSSSKTYMASAAKLGSHWIPTRRHPSAHERIETSVRRIPGWPNNSTRPKSRRRAVGSGPSALSKTTSSP